MAWLINPLDERQRATLQSQCGGKLSVANRAARFNPECCQRLTLRQPSREALEFLAKRNDVHLNYVEASLEWIFDSEDDLTDVFLFVLEHSLVKNQRGQLSKACLGKKAPTIYSGKRGAPIVAAHYPSKRSKITKDPHTLKSERRLSGARSLKREHFGTASAIQGHDQLAYWLKHYKFYRIADFEGMGRAYNNYIARQEDPSAISRRKPLLIKAGSKTMINVDKRMGHLLLRSLGLFSDEQITVPGKATDRDPRNYPGYSMIHQARTIQNLYDRLNRFIPLDRFMVEIDISELMLSIWDESLIPMKQPI